MNPIRQIITKFQTRFLNSPNKISILLLVFWAFASRGLGLVRDSLMGRLSPIEGEMFNAASILNENIVTFFILGSVGVALLPQIIKLESLKNKIDQQIDQASEKYKILWTKMLNGYISWCLLIFSLFITVLCFTGIIFSDYFLHLINADLYDRIKQTGQLSNYIVLNQIFLLAPILFALKTILGVFLNAKKSFKVFALDGVLSNLYAYFGIVGTAWGLVIGFSIALICFAWDAFRIGLRFDLFVFPELKGYLWQSFLLFLPRILIFPAARTAETLITVLTKDTGEITSIRMAINIQGVFYGLMVAVGTVFLPDLATILVEQGKSKEFWKHLSKYLRITSIVSLVATVVTVIGSPLILFLIKSLAMVKTDSFLNQENLVNLILSLVAIGSVSIFLQSLNEILNRYYIALEENWFPIISSLIANGVGILTCVIFYKQINTAQLVMIGFVLNNLVLTLLLGGKCWWVYSRTRLLIRKENREG
jgi:peptidoglycan biosynthesis protein MviN/MurJ (putative lipid II flippase)